VFKRIVWFGVGAAAGSAGTVWTQRKVRAQMERATPARIAGAASDAGRRVGAVVRDAVSEGRAAANDRERELRQRMSPGAPTPRLRALPDR
jgi:hypothetical protein